MDLVGDDNRVTKSRDCFRVWYKRLKQIHFPNSIYPPVTNDSLATIQNDYASFYNKNQAEIGHYFRHLYHIIKFVKHSQVPDKRQYTSLVRAQLSSYEQVFLFYNCLSKQGIEKFKPLVEEFSLLENMPQELLLNPSHHLPLYAKTAYGDDIQKLKEAG